MAAKVQRCAECNHKLPMHDASCLMPKFWAMSDDQRVIDLNRQLYEGLIHPVEYAQAVEPIANEFGLGWRAA